MWLMIALGGEKPLKVKQSSALVSACASNRHEVRNIDTTVSAWRPKKQLPDQGQCCDVKQFTSKSEHLVQRSGTPHWAKGMASIIQTGSPPPAPKMDSSYNGKRSRQVLILQSQLRKRPATRQQQQCTRKDNRGSESLLAGRLFIFVAISQRLRLAYRQTSP